MAKEKESLEVKVKALEELTELQAKSISSLIEKQDELQEEVESIQKELSVLSSNIGQITQGNSEIAKHVQGLTERLNDIDENLSKSRVPVPEKELAEIKQFLKKVLHYKEK